MQRIGIILSTVLWSSLAGADVKPLDPNSEEALGQQINRAAGRLAPTTNPAARREAAAVEASAARAAELDAKFDAIQREVARLRALGAAGQGRADALERELQAVRGRRDARGVIKGTEPELHVVGVYEGLPPGDANQAAPATQPRQRRRENLKGRGAAVVDVQPTGRPIVLVLCAYEPVAWDVRVAKDVDLRKVIVSGYYEPTVAGLRAETPLELSSHERGGEGGYFFTYGKESDGHEAMAKINNRTGLEPATLQGAYRYPGEPFVVGPGGEEWVAQRVLSELEPLYLRATAWELAKRREDVAGLRFTAIRFGELGPRAGTSVGDFSPLGALVENHRPLPRGAMAAAVDPAEGTVYALTSQSVIRVDGKTREQSTIAPNDPNLPRLTRPTAIAFDAKRRRLVVAAMAMPDVLLFAYDANANKWSVLINLEGVALNGMVYSAKDDCFYGTPTFLGRRGVIIRITPDGDADQLIVPSRPSESAEAMPSREPTQLAVAGDRLVLLPGLSLRDSMPRRPGDAPPARRACYVIDSRSGEVTYAGKLGTPPDAPRELGAAEVAAAWTDLSSSDAAAAEAALAQLAAGGQQTVAFIRAELKPGAAPPPPGPQQVAAWIADLDVEDATRRDTATRELRRLGRTIEPVLRDALKASASPEATARLETLLAALAPEAGTARTSGRDANVSRLLARIGTPDAIELLGELSAGSPDAQQAREARRALEDFSREGVSR